MVSPMMKCCFANGELWICKVRIGVLRCGGMGWPIRVGKCGLIREEGLSGRAGTWRFLQLLCSLMGGETSSFVSCGIGSCDTRRRHW